MKPRSVAKSGACLCLITSAAHAAVTGAIWRQVNNTIGNPGADSFMGPQWNALSWFTFDLYLQGDQGQLINGINLTSPFGVHTNGSVFNHSLGGNVQSAFEFAPFNAMAYDTYVALGGSAAAPIISFTGGVNLSGSPGPLQAMWSTSPAVAIDSSGEFRIMRVTVGYLIGFDPFDPTSGGYLGTSGVAGLYFGNGPVSSLQVQLPNGEVASFVIGNAFEPIPTAGAAALLGVAGGAGLRRRRLA